MTTKCRRTKLVTRAANGIDVTLDKRGDGWHAVTPQGAEATAPTLAELLLGIRCPLSLVR